MAREASNENGGTHIYLGFTTLYHHIYCLINVYQWILKQEAGLATKIMLIDSLNEVHYQNEFHMSTSGTAISSSF